MRFSKGAIYNLGESPDSDWRALIIGFVLVSALTVGYSAYSLNSLASSFSAEPDTTDGVRGPRLLDEKRIEEVVNFYEKRKEFLESGEIPNIIDPSF